MLENARMSVMLLLFRGLPGTGKSTLARSLATRLKVPVFDRDLLKATALQEFGDETRSGTLSYAQLYALAEQQVQVSISAIIDAPFTQDATMQPLFAIGRQYDVPVKLIYCVAPLWLLRDRIFNRVGRVSDVQWSGSTGWEQFVARLRIDPAARRLLMPGGSPASADVLVVNTAQPPAACIDKIVQWLLIDGRRSAHDGVAET